MSDVSLFLAIAVVLHSDYMLSFSAIAWIYNLVSFSVCVVFANTDLLVSKRKKQTNKQTSANNNSGVLLL